jgi:predicted ATPase
MQTILEIGAEDDLQEAVDDAFPGAALEIRTESSLFSLGLRQPGLLRPLSAAELSDGTLRYLLLVAALLTPRPPALMILNEPETSLHPDLLPALGRLIRRAARSTQMIVVSHAAALIAALEIDEQCQTHNLEKENGATRVSGMGKLDGPAWQWPSR